MSNVFTWMRSFERSKWRYLSWFHWQFRPIQRSSCRRKVPFHGMSRACLLEVLKLRKQRFSSCLPAHADGTCIDKIHNEIRDKNGYTHSNEKYHIAFTKYLSFDITKMFGSQNKDAKATNYVAENAYSSTQRFTITQTKTFLVRQYRHTKKKELKPLATQQDSPYQQKGR